MSDGISRHRSSLHDPWPAPTEGTAAEPIIETKAGPSYRATTEQEPEEPDGTAVRDRKASRIGRNIMQLVADLKPEGKPHTREQLSGLIRDYCRLATDEDRDEDLLARAMLIRCIGRTLGKADYVRGLRELATSLAREGGTHAGSEAGILASMAARGDDDITLVADVFVDAFRTRLVTEATRTHYDDETLAEMASERSTFGAMSAASARALTECMLAELPALDPDGLERMLAWIFRVDVRHDPDSRQALRTLLREGLQRHAADMPLPALRAFVLQVFPRDPGIVDALKTMHGLEFDHRLEIAANLMYAATLGGAPPPDELLVAVLSMAAQAQPQHVSLIVAACLDAVPPTFDRAALLTRIEALAPTVANGAQIDVRKALAVVEAPGPTLAQLGPSEVAHAFIDRLMTPYLFPLQAHAHLRPEGERESAWIEHLAQTPFPPGRERDRAELILRVCRDALDPDARALRVLTPRAASIVHGVLLDEILAKPVHLQAGLPTRLAEVDVRHLMDKYASLTDPDEAYRTVLAQIVHDLDERATAHPGNETLQGLRGHAMRLLAFAQGQIGWPGSRDAKHAAAAAQSIQDMSHELRAGSSIRWPELVRQASGAQDHPLLEAMVLQLAGSPTSEAARDTYLAALADLDDTAACAALGALLSHDAAGASVRLTHIEKLLARKGLPPRLLPLLQVCKDLMAKVEAQPLRPAAELLHEQAQALLARADVAPERQRADLRVLAWAGRTCRLMPWTHSLDGWARDAASRAAGPQIETKRSDG